MIGKLKQKEKRKTHILFASKKGLNKAKQLSLCLCAMCIFHLGFSSSNIFFL